MTRFIVWYFTFQFTPDRDGAWAESRVSRWMYSHLRDVLFLVGHEEEASVVQDHTVHMLRPYRKGERGVNTCSVKELITHPSICFVFFQELTPKVFQFCFYKWTGNHTDGNWPTLDWKIVFEKKPGLEWNLLVQVVLLGSSFECF